MDLKAEDWGFRTGSDGGPIVAGARAEMLAREYGTPLHVLDEAAQAHQD